MTPLRRPELVMILVIALLAGLVEILVRPSVAAALQIGDKAPDFTLHSTTGEKISLTQFRGKKAVLLEFYGADFAPQ